MKISELLRTLVCYFLAGIVFLICVIPCCFIACLPESWRRDNPLFFWCVDFFYNGITWATLLPVTYEGLENIPQEPVIIAANHLSALDIPFLGSVLGTHPHIWMFLKKYAQVPIFGFVARRMNVVVDLDSKAALMRSLKQAIRLTKDKNRHLVIFPEGGRALNGTVEPFFEGFAVIAQMTGRPVVPVMLTNLDKAYPPGSFLLHRYPIRVVVGKPYMFQEGESRDAFIARVHQWFITESVRK